MYHRPLLLTTVLIHLAALPGSAEVPFTASEGVLVLRNGFVLRGQITPLGDHFLVTRSDSEVRIPASRVESACKDLEQAYLRKRDSVAPNDVRGHLLLADWCLQHQLHARASDQILAAAAWDPGHPRIRRLKNQLAAATRPVKERVREAAKVAEAAPLWESEPPQISADALRNYTTTIQPLLLNRCALGACHGVGGPSQFQLARPPVGQLVTSRLSQRNLRATLNHINRDSPSESRLLRTALRAHGGLTEPVISETDQAVTHTLLKWLEIIDQQDRRQPLSAQVRNPSALLQRGPGWSHNRPAIVPPRSEAPPPQRPDAERQDPFDPEVFNREQDPSKKGLDG